MRATKLVVSFGVLGAVAFAIGQASAASPGARSVRCTLHTYLKNGQISDQGAIVGSVACGHPFGRGSYDGRYRNNVNPQPFVGSETGTSKLSFEAGIVRDTYTIDQGPVAGTAPWHGTLHITGGTGRFTHLSGTLRMNCTHSIPPITHCTVSGPVFGI